MKTILIFSMLFLFQITGAQTINLQADSIRIRFQNQHGSWNQWQPNEYCNVPILFSPDLNMIRIKNANDMTFSILKGPNTKWFESQDYEGRHLVIVVYKNPDNTYNVMLQYDNIYDKGLLLAPGYSYQYWHCKKVKQ